MIPDPGTVGDDTVGRTRGGVDMIDTKNDEVRVFDNAAGEWGWRRVDLGNGRIVSRSSGSDSGGYVDHDYAVEAAKAYNADGCRVVEHTPVGVVVHREEQ